MNNPNHPATFPNGDPHVPVAAMVDAFYGVADDRAMASLHAHLAECKACSDRWEALAYRRSASVTSEVSPEFLAAQRRKVYERIERSRPNIWRVWVPAATAAVALTVAVFMFGPGAEPVKEETRVASTVASNISNNIANNDVSDAELFSDVYSLEQSYEPSAAVPIQALFVDESDRSDPVEERN
ncbi:MAG: hypothetical protein ABL967_01330 [Bryobacteraceae bacterium]